MRIVHECGLCKIREKDLGTPVGKKTQVYVALFSTAQEIAGFFRFIIEKKQKEEEKINSTDSICKMFRDFL